LGQSQGERKKERERERERKKEWGIEKRREETGRLTEAWASNAA
jgi:hypothetical protein